MNRIAPMLLSAGLAVSLATFVHAADAQSSQVLDSGRVQSPSGRWFDVVKQIVDGRKETMYRSGDLVLSDDEYRAWVKQNPAPRIDPALTSLVAKSAPQALVPVAVTLKHNPYESIRAQVEAAHKPEFDALEARRQALYAREFAPSFAGTQQRESWIAAMNIVGDAANDPLRAERQGIARDHEALTATVRQETNQRLLPAINDSQKQLALLVEALGGTVRGVTNIVNGASVYIPAMNVQALANDARVGGLLLNAPGEKELANQGVSLGLTTGFWANGIDGGIWDGGQLDSGIQQNHPTFGAVGPVAALSFLNGPGRGSTDSDGHGTAVASIIAGRDATNRGMAFGIDTHLNAAWDDVTVSLDWAFATAAQDPEVVNGSFGIPASSPSVADYTPTETYIDYMIRTQNALYTKSAGNLGPGANTLTQPAGIYNGLAVANINDTNNTNRADDFINDSSSRGPTLAGRKKPDIAAPGSPTTAANNLWAGAGADWITFGGTSSAAPHVAGGVLLLTDARGSDSPLPIKAILINSANGWTDNGTLSDETDDGPLASMEWNASYGWGYLNLGAAYTNRFNVISSTIAGTPAHKLYKGTIAANGRATLTWNRFVTTAAGVYTAQTLTDLDLLMYRQNDGVLADFSTTIDENVELVSSATAQPVVLKVDAFSAIDPQIGATDAFALAHTGGFTEVALPTLTSIGVPGTVSPGEPFTFNVIVSNNSPDLPIHNVVVTLGAMPVGWTLSSPAAVNVGTLQASGDSFSAQFTVTPPCNLAGTSATLNWTLAHTSYGQAVTTPDSQLVTVAPITGLTINTPTAVTTPRTYSFAVGAGDWYAVAGAEVASRNINIRGDNDACITSPWQDSTFLSVPDFLFVNGHAVGASTQYAHIYEAAGNTTATTIEYDDAFDLVLASEYDMVFSANEPVEPAERSLNTGKLYRVEARVVSGFIDPAVFFYRPTQTFVERSSAVVSRNATGGAPGAVERFNYRALETGVHGAVVSNENAVAGTVRFEIRCAADYNSSGAISVQDIFDFLADWFAGSTAADFNLSGGAPTVQDIFDFLAEWFNGC